MDQRESFIIKGLGGKKTLEGELVVSGAKNATLPLMAASVLFEDGFLMKNVPDITDISRMSELIEELGGKIKRDKEEGTLEIDTTEIGGTEINREISKHLRASIILSGPVLARYGSVSFPHPGGCVIGSRPIDVFLDGFKQMGAKVEHSDKDYKITSRGKLSGARIFMKSPSVTATETFIMAAVLADGETVIENCAMEPEIKSLADFLVLCGAEIEGAGTPTIRIEGGSSLNSHGNVYETLPDRIEAGSFLILGALCANNLKIKKCNPGDLGIVVELLREAGVPIEISDDCIFIKNNSSIPNKNFKSFGIRTHEFPGFPTDLQAPMTVFLTQVSGESLVFETIFEGRLNYTEDLVKMGANIKMWDSHRVTVKGPSKLKGKDLEGPDIRAGLALIIAALVADGQSEITNIHFIDRGYEDIEGRLRSVRAEIKRVK